MREHIRKLIDLRYLEVCNSQMAFDWLSKQEPPRSVYRNRFSLTDDHSDLEWVLFERNDALIDHGLARYGWACDVASKLYTRIGHADRCTMRACHIAGGGPSEPFDLLSAISPDTMAELTCWVTNPNIGDQNFDYLFKRENVFSLLNEEQFQKVLASSGANPRISTPYKSLFMDGWDQYSYHRVFDEAWLLTMHVPMSQEWASVLESLLQNAVAWSPSLDVSAALERWRIDDKPEDSTEWFNHSPSWYLRGIIARLLKPTSDILHSSDMALRASFYSRFDPAKFPNWANFAEHDGSVFFEYALQNEALWRVEEDRHQLEGLAWAMPDPRSSLDAPNHYKAVEERMRKKYPGWFADEEPAAP
ncbi:hypothetical protein [Xanthobacter autotrophicus]|uniref:hypothetical protein n=1 Tax=Xanthobacter autotrophicus TaxID=280 RepID=UPI003727AD99